MLLSGKGQPMVLEWMTHKEHFNLFCVRKNKNTFEVQYAKWKSVHWLRAWDFWNRNIWIPSTVFTHCVSLDISSVKYKQDIVSTNIL